MPRFNPFGIVPSWWRIAVGLILMELALVRYLSTNFKLKVLTAHHSQCSEAAERLVPAQRDVSPAAQVGYPTYIALIALALVFAPAFRETDPDKVPLPASVAVSAQIFVRI